VIMRFTYRATLIHGLYAGKKSLKSPSRQALCRETSLPRCLLKAARTGPESLR
jgi:hypothetical protein